MKLLVIIICFSAFNIFCGISNVFCQTPINLDRQSKGSSIEAPANNSVTMAVGAVVRLERLNGGDCKDCPPRYTLTIYADGTVIYEGIEFVKTKGKVTTNIGKEKVKQIMDSFEKTDFFSIKRDYIAIDRPVATLSASFRGNANRIENSYSTGGFYTDNKEAQSLMALENEIDEVVQSGQWVK